MAAAITLPLLDLWERGQDGSRIDRGVRLARAAWPGTVPEEIHIGQCDALVLDLREALFGDRLELALRCPQCAEQLEATLDVAAVRVAREERTSLRDASGEVFEVKPADGEVVRFRLPTTDDLRAISVFTDTEVARRALLRRCVLNPPAGEHDLPGDAEALVVAAMARTDPQAMVRLPVHCPACQHAWSQPFDIVEYLWAELDSAAHRLLDEVTELAAAYGWSEREILAMHPVRRARYLERAHG